MKTILLPRTAIALACSLISGLSTAQEAVLITATRQEQALQTAPIGASVLLGEDIRRAGVRDANEALRLLSGVPSRGDLNGGREFGLDLRGYGESAGQNLVVVIDGIRITENELASARLSAISPEMIERIEIVRGGASVLWGEGASGGVIQVVTRGVKPGLAGNASLALESFGGRDLQGGVQIGAANGWSVFARLRDNHSGGYRANSAFDQRVASLGTAWNGQGMKIALSYDREEQDGRFPGSLTQAQFAADPRQSKTPQDKGKTTNEKFALNASAKLGNWKLDIDAAQRQREVDSSFVSLGYSSHSSTQQTQISPRLSYSGALANVPITALIGHDSLNWTGHYTSASSFGNGDENAKQSNRAWYGKLDAQLASSTRASLGARKEHIRKQSSDPANFIAYNNPYDLSAWDAAVNQTLAPGMDAYVRLAKSYRVANVDENRYVASPLKPMQARDEELGLKYSRSLQSAALRVFRQRSDNEIAFDNNLFVNVNQDAISRSGVELEGKSSLGGGFDLQASAQHISAKYVGGPNIGKRVPLVSGLTLNARLGYALAARQRLELGLQKRSSAVQGGDYSNACAQMPSHSQWDLRYSWKQFDAAQGWRLNASVDNLTNKSAYSYAFPFACSGGIYPDAGRALRASASYAF